MPIDTMSVMLYTDWWLLLQTVSCELMHTLIDLLPFNFPVQNSTPTHIDVFVFLLFGEYYILRG
jgi:hypothetical protein